MEVTFNELVVASFNDTTVQVFILKLRVANYELNLELYNLGKNLSSKTLKLQVAKVFFELIF